MMGAESILVQAIYLIVFTGCFYYLTYNLQHRFNHIASIVVLAVGLFLIYVPPEKILSVTLLRYLKFVILYTSWAWVFLKIKTRYALYLSVFYTIFMGVWFSCIQIAFLYFHITNGIALTACTGICRVASVILIKKYFIEVNDNRTINLHDLLIGVFPAVTCFIANLAMYELLDSPDMPRTGNISVTLHFLVVFFGLSALLILISTESYFKLMKYKNESEHAQNQLSTQYLLFLKERKSNELVKALHHDMQNHLHTLENLAQVDGIRAYISNLQQAVDTLNPPAQTGNTTLDVILNSKQPLCAEKHIALTAYISFEKGSFLSSMDICTLFANCIDNAIEAVDHENIADKHIHLAGGDINGNLVVKVENPYAHALIPKGDSFKSTKCDGFTHGYGLINMRKTVEKHNGAMTFKTENNQFVVIWMIPIPAQST